VGHKDGAEGVCAKLRLDKDEHIELEFEFLPMLMGRVEDDLELRDEILFKSIFAVSGRWLILIEFRYFLSSAGWYLEHAFALNNNAFFSCEISVSISLSYPSSHALLLLFICGCFNVASAALSIGTSSPTEEKILVVSALLLGFCPVIFLIEIGEILVLFFALIPASINLLLGSSLIFFVVWQGGLLEFRFFVSPPLFDCVMAIDRGRARSSSSLMSSSSP